MWILECRYGVRGSGYRAVLSLGCGDGPLTVACDAVPVQLAHVVRGAGEQPFAFAGGEAPPGHHGQVLAGLELPEYWFTVRDRSR